MNKREFVLGGCAALAGTAASAHPGGPPDADVGARIGLRRQLLPDLAGEPGSDAWRTYIGHRFQVLAAGAETTLVLGGVAARKATAGFDQFTLSLHADAGTGLPAGTYRLRHGTGQEVTVYLESTGLAGQARASYRADFNVAA
jgi:hypothetical protein